MVRGVAVAGRRASGGVTVRFKLGRFTVALLGMVGGAALATEPLVFNTEDYPPFNYERPSGRVSGISTEILREAAERAEVDATFRMQPWARSYAMAQRQAGHCVYSTSRTDEREDAFTWVGPLADNDWAVFARPDADIQINDLDDLHDYRVGGFRDDATTQYLESRGIDVATVSRDSVNARLLSVGRIDLWATGGRVAPWLAEREGAGEVEALHVFRQVDLYLACHPDTPAAALEALQEALDEMRADGAMQSIRDDYG